MATVQLWGASATRSSTVHERMNRSKILQFDTNSQFTIYIYIYDTDIIICKKIPQSASIFNSQFECSTSLPPKFSLILRIY